MKKILFIVTQSEYGGVQTHIFQLSQYLKFKGDKVAVMAYPQGWLEKNIKKLGLKFYPNYFLSNKINPIQDFKAMREIKKAILDFKPDLVSCHSSKAGFLTRLVIRNKIPTIFTAHGWGFDPGTPFWRKILILTEKIAAHFCQKIICVSNFHKNLALKYKIAPLEKLIVIYNGVEIKKTQNSKLKNENSKMKIVFLGRLVAQKDPMLLIKAFKKLPLEIKNKTEILIIGEGRKRKILEKFIKKNDLKNFVKILGEIEREKVFSILKNSDIFVLTSNWEGIPRSILEAMSFGLPIIASEVGGIKELINSKCGILIKKGNINELKLALEKLLNNSSLRKKMGKNALIRIQKKFSLKRMLEKTYQLYQEILFKNSQNL
jgi:glycosyltransferase involved in cell wall biosynthesis